VCLRVFQCVCAFQTFVCFSVLECASVRFASDTFRHLRLCVPNAVLTALLYKHNFVTVDFMYLCLNLHRGGYLRPKMARFLHAPRVWAP